MAGGLCGSLRYPLPLAALPQRLGRAGHQQTDGAVGARLVAPAESFFVTSKTGPLQDGELERAGRWARAWARALHDKLEKTRT